MIRVSMYVLFLCSSMPGVDAEGPACSSSDLSCLDQNTLLQSRVKATPIDLQVKSLPSSARLLYGYPAANIDPGWTSKDPGNNAGCHVQRLAGKFQETNKGTPPLHCSTGGYDRCPERVLCGGPFWSKQFVVTISDDAYTSLSPGYRAADIIMADWPMRSIDVETNVNQSRSVLTMESWHRYKTQTKVAYAKENLDFSFGFRRGVMTEQTSYFLSDPRLLYDSPPVPFELREKRALAVSCISNFAANRTKWLLKFSQLVTTHNLCGVGHNVPADAALKPYGKFSSEGPRDKVEHFRKYKFCIAHENDIASGYVTEKLYDCLRAGSIPIYIGAPDVNLVWPYANETILSVKDFNMEQLVARMNEIASNVTLFNSFHAWRTKPVPTQVMGLLFNGLGNIMCRACVKHHQRMSGKMSPKVPEWWSNQHGYFLAP